LKYNHWLPRTIGVNGIVLFGTIYYAMSENEVSDRLRRHEEKHREQQEEDGYFRFKIKYGLSFVKNLLRYRNFRMAYYKIPYEIEAREAEKEGVR